MYGGWSKHNYGGIIKVRLGLPTCMQVNSWLITKELTRCFRKAFIQRWDRMLIRSECSWKEIQNFTYTNSHFSSHYHAIKILSTGESHTWYRCVSCRPWIIGQWISIARSLQRVRGTQPNVALRLSHIGKNEQKGMHWLKKKWCVSGFVFTNNFFLWCYYLDALAGSCFNLGL